MLKETPITITETSVSALDLSALLTLSEYYTFQHEGNSYCFKVVSRIDNSTLSIEWAQREPAEEGGPNPALTPSTFPIIITNLYRGFESEYSALYALNFLNRGYLDIDNIVFDMFSKKVCKWNWLGDSYLNQFEGNSKFVDFFFFNKRPITRQPYAEKTLGAVDNVDLTWQTNKESSNPSSITTHPYMVFQPLEVIPYSDELYRVEEFYNFLNKIPQELLDVNYNDIEMYQPPQIHEFSYQVTAVTDSHKDARLLQAHLYNSLIPLDRGERYVRFPSGMTHTVKVEQSGIVALEEEGAFEVTTTFTFYLPLIEQHPELTYSWVTSTLNLTDLEEVTG